MISHAFKVELNSRRFTYWPRNFDIFMFLELLNNIFPLFINNIFQSYKIILQYFYVHVSIFAHTWIDTSSNQKFQFARTFHQKLYKPP
jgi:hypothetical protein